MKLKPWMVSVLCLIIALPLVANSAFSAPITTADLGFSPSFRRAWENAHTRSKMKTTEGTAQPEWLDRFRKVRTPNQRRDGLHASRGTDFKWGADVPGFEPGFSA